MEKLKSLMLLYDRKSTIIFLITPRYMPFFYIRTAPWCPTRGTRGTKKTWALRENKKCDTCTGNKKYIFVSHVIYIVMLFVMYISSRTRGDKKYTPTRAFHHMWEMDGGKPCAQISKPMGYHHTQPIVNFLF